MPKMSLGLLTVDLNVIRTVSPFSITMNWEEKLYSAVFGWNEFKQKSVWFKRIHKNVSTHSSCDYLANSCVSMSIDAFQMQLNLWQQDKLLGKICYLCHYCYQKCATNKKCRTASRCWDQCFTLACYQSNNAGEFQKILQICPLKLPLASLT